MSVLVARGGEREKKREELVGAGRANERRGRSVYVISRIIIIIPFPLSLFFVFSVKLDEP